MRIEITYRNARPIIFDVNPTPVTDIVRRWASDIEYDPSDAQKEAANIRTLLGEDVLNLVQVPLDPQKGIAEIEQLTEFFRLQQADETLAQLQPLVGGIPVQGFRHLYSKLNNASSPENYVNGLRIHLGIDPETENPTEIVPVYQPLMMFRDEEGLYDPQDNPLFFLFTGGTFEPVSEEILQAYTKAYRKKIRIRIPPGPDFESYNELQDTGSLIFPFQTIFTLAEENNAAENIWLYNAVRDKNPDSGLPERPRHCILLLSTSLNGNQHPSMQGMYANRSRLCPPDCRAIRYDVIIQQLKAEVGAYAPS